MLLDPMERGNAIVGVKWQGGFTWYVTYKDIWAMDNNRVREIYLNKIKDTKIPPSNIVFGEESERRDIEVLDENSFACFAQRIEKYIATVEDLRINLMLCLETFPLQKAQYSAMPQLYLDFDVHILYMSEFLFDDLVNTVPSHWTGQRKNFLDIVEESERYWYDSKRKQNLLEGL